MTDESNDLQPCTPITVTGITPGDIVILASIPSPSMTVEALSDEGKATCVWWDSDERKFKRTTINVAALIPDA